MVIQVLLLVAVAGLLFGFIRWQHGVRLQAGKRLAFFGFLALNVWAVLRPDDVTYVAQRLGVGRGADLLLYLLVVAFIFVVLNFYLRFRDMGDRLTDLARAVALREAELVNRERGVLTEPAHTLPAPPPPPEAP
ncbi:MAG: DUF2304 domain-containing protein [Micromonosporaceae bacterium]